MSNVIDVSAEYLDDIDLSDFEALEKELESTDSGSVYWPSGENPEKLFDFEFTDDSASINFTDLGRKFFRVQGNSVSNVDHMAFSHYMGLQTENRHDLEMRVDKATGLPFVNFEGIVDAAKKEGRLSISGRDQKPRLSMTTPGAQTIVSNDYSDLASKCDGNTVSFGQTRSLASIYMMDKGIVKPYMVKFPRSGSNLETQKGESRMLAFEYAALSAMKEHGINAVDAKIFKSPDSRMHLITERFDGQQYSPSGEAHTPYKLFTPISWTETVKTGDFKPANPSQASSVMMDMTESNEALSQSVLTRYMFNKLIGNADAHGFNVGIVSRIEDSKVRKTVAPAFDVTPYLMDQCSNEAAKDYGVHGLVLSEAKLEDFVKTDPLLSEMSARKPDMLKTAFQKASDIRSTMMNIVDNKLVAEGYIGSSDARALRSYLDNPVGESVAPHASARNNPSPMTSLPRDESSVDAFRRKALGLDQTVVRDEGYKH